MKKGTHKDESYIRPKEAARKLKMAQNTKRTVYLYGVTGTGKTALVEDVLGKRGYAYYPAGETLPDQVCVPKEGKQQIIVFDDLHTVAGAQLRDEYAALFDSLMERKDIWLILISRCKVARWLMPLHVQYLFLIIGEEDLRLDRTQQDLYFEKWGMPLPWETSEKIWQRAGGNPLSLRMAMLAKGDVKLAEQAMCDYLEAHVYDQWDVEIQEFIMEMSVVDRFDAQSARLVTGRNDVEQLIDRAQETGDFLLEKDGEYEYRPILKRSMEKRLAREYPPERMKRLFYNAAHMHETKDQIPEALRLYEKIGDREGIARLLVTNARKNPGTGHYYQLRKYYLSLSEETVRESPVLMAGMSMLQSILLNGEESERWYRALEEYAAAQGGSAKREAKSRLLYLDIALPHRGTINMTDILKSAGTLLKERKVMLPEFAVTSNLPSMMNGGKDFCDWSLRDTELAASIGKITEFVLGKYGKGLVSLALAESRLEKGVDSYAVAALAQKGQMQAIGGGKTEQRFVATGILVWLALLNGSTRDAADMLAAFAKRAKEDAPWLMPNIRAMQCRISLYGGDLTAVQDWMREAPDENEDFYSMERLRYLTKVRVYIQNGKYEKAYGLLQKLLCYAEKHKRTFIRMESLLLLSIVQYRTGAQDWRQSLQECIGQAQHYHFVRIFSREGAAVLELLKAGSFDWKKMEFKEQVLRECESMAGFYPSYLKERTTGTVVLSDNALKILRLQAEGFSAEQIAQKLNITRSTVKYHCRETYRKLGVNGKAAAVSEARNRKLI